jgi:2-succinyl-5-enolpyruvyl-6-hydroxy-3-cyclohexene-1-carboxylate synthase
MSTRIIGHGVKTVTTAGTDVALVSASTPCRWVTIQAQTDNTGIIAVGASGVDATVATGTGVALAVSESITLAIDNLDDIYIDSTVNGEGVRYTYGL